MDGSYWSWNDIDGRIFIKKMITLLLIGAIVITNLPPVPPKVEKPHLFPSRSVYVPPSPSVLPTHHGPTRPVAEQREERMGNVRIIYPSIKLVGTNFHLRFEGLGTTNRCLLQYKLEKNWDNVRSWVPNENVSLTVTNINGAKRYRMLIPVNRRKGE